MLVGLAGMSLAVSCYPERRARVETRSARTQLILAAARDRQISMFGDLPNSPDAGYVMRTAMSLRQHTFTEEGADFDVAVDSTGERLVFASTRHHLRPDLYLKSVRGMAVAQLTSDPASDIQPTFSPDDTRVAFASNRGGNWDIWVVKVTGGPPVQVTHGQADELHPSWSPDGTQLVFCSRQSRDRQWELWIADARGGAMRKLIGYGLFPEWSPRGDTIVYQRARERGSRRFSIWMLTLVGGEPGYPTELTASQAHATMLPTWSDDGRRVSYVSTELPPRAAESGMSGPIVGQPETVESSRLDIWVIGVNGNGKTRLTDGQTMNHGPTFSPNGRIFYTGNRSGHENIWSLLPGGPVAVMSEEGSVTDVRSNRADFSRADAKGSVVNDGL